MSTIFLAEKAPLGASNCSSSACIGIPWGLDGFVVRNKEITRRRSLLFFYVTRPQHKFQSLLGNCIDILSKYNNSYTTKDCHSITALQLQIGIFNMLVRLQQQWTDFKIQPSYKHTKQVNRRGCLQLSELQCFAGR
jgi:hypothetical protein